MGFGFWRWERQCVGLFGWWHMMGSDIYVIAPRSESQHWGNCEHHGRLGYRLPTNHYRVHYYA